MSISTLLVIPLIHNYVTSLWQFDVTSILSVTVDALVCTNHIPRVSFLTHLLRCRPAKGVGGKPSRGFESLRLRHKLMTDYDGLVFVWRFVSTPFGVCAFGATPKRSSLGRFRQLLGLGERPFTISNVS